jgi:hypothetical protein
VAGRIYVPQASFDNLTARLRYFLKPSPANFANQSSTSFRPVQIYPPLADLFAGNSIVLYRNCRWTQAGLSQMFTSRKDLPKYTLLAEKKPCLPREVRRVLPHRG